MINTLTPHVKFVILVCDYMSSSFTLVKMYAPNSGQIGFLDELFVLIQQHYSQPFMIVGGDFSLVMSHTRDRDALFRDTPSPHFEYVSDPTACLMPGELNIYHIGNILFILWLISSYQLH